MRICVYGASSRTIDKKYITAVEEMGEMMAKRGHSLVFGGGDGGLMGAAARGFKRGGAKEIISIAPKFFNVDGVLYEEATEYHSPDTMRERKQLLEDKADVFVVVPGGIGTFDEFFEIITLRSLARHPKPVVIYNVCGYYDLLLEMLEKCEEEGFVNLCDGKLYSVFSDASELIDYIENTKEEFLNPHKFKNIQ